MFLPVNKLLINKGSTKKKIQIAYRSQYGTGNTISGGCESTTSVDGAKVQESQNLLKVGRTSIWADCQIYAAL
jgi:hypothetical protein